MPNHVIALIALLLSAPALAGDRLEKLLPEYRESSDAALFRPDEHPAATALIVSGAFATAVIFVAVTIFVAQKQNVAFPNCVGAPCR